MRVDGSNSTQHTIDTISRFQANAKAQGGRFTSPPSHSEPVKLFVEEEATVFAAPPAPLPASTPAPAPASAPEADAAGDSTDEAKGVLRLIDAGHFRGVADVRLRINFAEELQGIQSAETDALLRDAIPALQEALNGAIDSFVEGGTLSEEEIGQLRTAQEAFNTQVSSLVESEGGITTDVFAELRTAFQDFLNSLVPPNDEESAATPLDSSVVEETGGDVVIEAASVVEEGAGAAGVLSAEPVDGTEAATDIFAGLRDTLSGIFDEVLADLQESADALGLPPLSEPNGNGRAFEKFLAIYNERFGVGGETSTASPEAGIDTVT